MTPLLRSRVPAEPLRALVSGYWHLDAPTATGSVERFLPGTGVTWIFMLGPVGSYELGGRAGEQPRAFVNGILRAPCLVRAGGATRNIGVAFRPGAARAFHALELGAMDGQLVDLEATGDAPLAALARRVRSEPSFDVAATLLDDLLCARLGAAQSVGIGQRLAALVDSGAVHDVRELAARSGYSERQLRRVCRQEIGSSPKALLRIARARAVARSLRASREPLTQVAHRFGYFDQAHFVHDFKQIVGLTPGRFRAETRPLASLFE